MKTILSTILSIIAVLIFYLLLLLGFYKFIIYLKPSGNNDIVVVLLFGIFSLVAGLLILLYLFAKKNLLVCGRRLYCFYFALLAGIGITSSITIYMRTMITWDNAMKSLIIPYGIIAFITILVLAIHRFYVAMLISLVIFGFDLLLIKGLELRQLNQVFTLKSEWVNEGWTMNMKEVVKKPGNIKNCKPWIEYMKYVELEEWELFYEGIDDFIDLVKDNVSTGVKEEQNPLNFNLEDDMNWPQFIKSNETIYNGIKSCPFISEFNYDAEQINDPRDKDALIIYKWAKGLMADALFKAKNNKIETSKEYCLALHMISDKLLANGQFKQHFLYGLEIDNYSVVCLAAISSISGSYLNIAGLDFLDTYSISSKSFRAPLLTILEIEHISLYKSCINLYSAGHENYMDRFFVPAVDKEKFASCIDNLNAFADRRRWLKEHAGKLGSVQSWRPFFSMHSADNTRSEILNDIFYRLTDRVILWKVLLGVDVVINYYHSRAGILPADSEIRMQLPVDISIKEPLKYVRINERSFTVYSRGWTTVDYKSERLGISRENQDDIQQNIGFRVTLPEIQTVVVPE